MGMAFRGGTLGYWRPLHVDCWIFSRSGGHFQWSTNPPLLHSFNKYLLSTSNVLGIVLGPGDPAVKKTKIPCVA